MSLACLRRVLFAALISLAAATDSRAITLDEFPGDGVATSTVAGSRAASLTPSSGAVGGVRTLVAVKNSFGAGISRIETYPDPDHAGDADSSLGYTQGAHTGEGVVIWDGDLDAASVNASGLPSIDLTQDDGTAMRIGIKFFDYPSLQPVDLSLRLHETGAAGGEKFSEVTVKLDRAIASLPALEIVVPFALFAAPGPSIVASPAGGAGFPAQTSFGQDGGAALTKLGAMELRINGLANSSAPDLVIDYVKTNGRCVSVPNAAGRVVDECGVCLESADANKGRDGCGVCRFGPPGYSYAPVVDECGLCPGAQSFMNAKDACGVCFGNGPDACGVCGGSAATAAQCAPSCVTVVASEEVIEFERRLISKARRLIDKFTDETLRSKRNNCKIKTRTAFSRVKASYAEIRARGRKIFKTGVEVCGNSCVTVSYAEEVIELTPIFRFLERQTLWVANEVKKCYVRKRIQSGSIRGVATTVRDVRDGLNQLIEDCKDRQVCPP